MGDELVQQAAGGICGDAWWTNPTRMNYLFSGSSGGGSMSGLAPYCSGGLLGGDMGGYGWLSCEIEDTVRGKLAPSSNFFDGKLETASNSVRDSDGTINGFPASDHEVREEQRLDQQAPAGSADSGCGGLMDAGAAFEMMGFGLSPSPASDWSQQSLFAGSSGTAEGNYKSILQAEDSSASRLKLLQESKDWNSAALNSSSSINDQAGDDVSRYLHDRVQVSSYHDEPFPGRHDHQPPPPPPPAAAACQMNGFLLNGRGPPLLTTTSSTTSTALEDISALTTTGLLGTPPSAINITQPPSSNMNPILASMIRMEERVLNEGQLQGSASVCSRTSKDEQRAFKRPRIETPSPLPTFKVRKEKLGDRITALQQIVSPFGKTDTASVLHEAIDYIKFLHNQVQILTRPYFEDYGAPAQHQHHQQDKPKEEKVESGGQQDLRSRGLCLVPLPSTFHAAAETPAVEFWAPTFGSTFS